jgi:hypothetical protein
MKLHSSLIATCIAALAMSPVQIFAQSSAGNASQPMQQDSQPPSLASSLNTGEKKLTGCVGSDNGRYLLRSKPHKKIWVSGPQDFAPHVGHTVTLYGTFLDPTAPATPARKDQGEVESPNRQGTNFQVSRIEMVSETCLLKSGKGTGNSPDRP